MKQEKILTIVFDGDIPRIVELENSCASFCDELGCTMIDVVHINVGGIEFDAIIDDEGLYNSPDKVTALWGSVDGQTVYQKLHGNIMLAHSDDEGNQTSINFASDFLAVMSSLVRITDNRNGKQTVGLVYNVGQVPPTREELLTRIFGSDHGDVEVIEA